MNAKTLKCVLSVFFFVLKHCKIKPYVLPALRSLGVGGCSCALVLFFSGISFSMTDDAGKGSVFSNDEKDIAVRYPEMFTIDPDSIKITVKEILEEDSTSYFQTIDREVLSAGQENPLVIIDQIINIAEKFWHIIQQNAPVVNLDTKYATAVPEGINMWTQLSNWKKPKAYLYGFYAKNLYGVKVINIEYKVIYTYGGTYKGKGAYLTGVTVTPTVVDVSWGYRFYMSAYVPDSTIANVGTDENPRAGMQINLSWKISTPIKEAQGKSIYYVEGDGYFEEIASPFDDKNESAYLDHDPAEDLNQGSAGTVPEWGLSLEPMTESENAKLENLESLRPLLTGGKIFE